MCASVFTTPPTCFNTSVPHNNEKAHVCEFELRLVRDGNLDPRFSKTQALCNNVGTRANAFFILSYYEFGMKGNRATDKTLLFQSKVLHPWLDFSKTHVFAITNATFLQMAGWPASLPAAWLAELAGLDLPSSPQVPPRRISSELVKSVERGLKKRLILKGVNLQ